MPFYYVQDVIKIYAFCRKIQQRASGPGMRALLGLRIYLSIHPKNCRIFPLNVATTLLSVLWKGAVGA